jgi:hypothetical protein
MRWVEHSTHRQYTRPAKKYVGIFENYKCLLGDISDAAAGPGHTRSHRQAEITYSGFQGNLDSSNHEVQ